MVTIHSASSFHLIAVLFADINECAMQGICNNGQCVNAQGGFQCQCKQGYALDGEGKDCLDIDECRISAELCGNGTCTNIPGSFRCDCFKGFENAPMMMEVCVGKCQSVLI